MWTGACWRSYFFRCLNKSFRCQSTSWINFGISQGLNTRLNMCVCVGIAISVVSCCLLLPLFFCGLPLLFYQYVKCGVTMCDIHLSRDVFIVSISSKLQKVLKEENAFLVPFWSYYVHAVTITNLFTKRCVFAPAIDSAIGSGSGERPSLNTWANMSLYDSCHLGLTQAEHTAAFAQPRKSRKSSYAFMPSCDSCSVISMSPVLRSLKLCKCRTPTSLWQKPSWWIKIDQERYHCTQPVLFST